MPNRIKTHLENLGNQKLLLPFFTAGYPNLSMTMELVKIAEAVGVDFIELGIPFSDPLADGPEIQYSSKVALDNGITVKQILNTVGKIRKNSNIPIILMGYYNPLIAYNESKFIKDAGNSGVDGLIIPDLPVEEALQFRETVSQNRLSLTFLVSPTSSIKRIKLIDKYSSDFVYAVTVTGVTGTGKVFGQATDNYLNKLKRLLNRRFVAGFGVSSEITAKRLSRYSDGVVIGSAIVKIIKNA
ncbi:MAG: tryptophan synthase subunit alpha, partial [Candidatus Zixiibacteriota bacterium]